VGGALLAGGFGVGTAAVWDELGVFGFLALSGSSGASHPVAVSAASRARAAAKDRGAVTRPR
jgi:hypothetical protein